jgi:hypothetical protein
MDVTARPRALIEPVPAHRTAGITVVQAADGAAEVAMTTSPGLPASSARCTPAA